MPRYSICLSLLVLTIQSVYLPIRSQELQGNVLTTLYAGKESPVGLLQVWDVTSEGGDGYETFFATGAGLAVYDGTRWDLYSDEGSRILRALCYDSEKGRLLSAGVNGFGYWQRDGLGGYRYTSMYYNGDFRSSSEEFWRVAISGGHYWFQSRRRILETDREGKLLRELPASDNIHFMYSVGGGIWYQDGDRLLNIVEDGQVLVAKVSDRIMNIVQMSSGIVVAFEYGGLNLLTAGGKLDPLDSHTNEVLSSARITGCSRIDSERMAVTTTRAACFVVGADGRIQPFRMETPNSSAFTALCAGPDSRGNLWLGLDSGVAHVEINSPDRYFTNPGLGQVHAVLGMQDGTMLIGSGKGLFCYDGKTLSPKGLTGPVWSIRRIDGKVYVSHDRGLYLFREDGSLERLPGRSGSYAVVPGIREDRYIHSTYAGMEILELSEGMVRKSLEIEGFRGYARHFALDSRGHIWIPTPGDGFVRLTLSEDMTELEDTKSFTLTSNHDAAAFSFEAEGELLLVCDDKVWSISADSLILNNRYTEMLSLCGEGVRALRERSDKLWFISSAGPGNITLQDGPARTRYTSASGTIGDRITPEIFSVGNNLVIGYRNGVAFTGEGGGVQLPLRIRRLSAVGADRTKRFPVPTDRISVPNNMNTLRIYPEGVPADGMLQYSLSTADKEWKNIKVDDYLEFASLTAGKHIIRLRIPGAQGPELTVSVKVGRPWYVSPMMLIVYLLLVLILVSVAAQFVRMRERQKIIALEKNALQADLRSKEKELANTTLQSSRRNALLNELKADASEISGSGDLPSAKAVSVRLIRKINGVLEDDSTWKQSEDYFNTIYDGLLDRLLEKYPSLTKTDMKLCVYLKLNLTTKEIAELMSISPRSVEVSRYRLRKKLGVPPDATIASVLK